MKEQDKKTEFLILDAAKRIFLSKGFDGARMQEIADEAGINKALLHYYFRSKDKLFDAIFNEAFNRFFPQVAETLNSDKPLVKKIRIFVDSYITLLIENPILPQFVIHEMNRNPERIVEIIKNIGIKPESLFKDVRNELNDGNSGDIKPEHFMVNLISLCIFPFIAKPILQGFIFGNDEDKYKQFLSERKEEVTRFALSSLASLRRRPADSKERKEVKTPKDVKGPDLQLSLLD